MTAPHVLSPAHVATILAYITDTHSTEAKRRLGIRNKVLFLLMLDAGLRSNEVRQLTLTDLYWEGRPRETIEIRPEIAKYAVGGNIPLSPRLKQALAQYYETYDLSPMTWQSHYAFAHPKTTCLLTNRQIRRIIETVGQVALGRHIHPHLLRHTFGDMLRKVTDIRTVQELMRHKDIRSTMIYTHPSQTDKENAITKMTPKPPENQP